MRLKLTILAIFVTFLAFGTFIDSSEINAAVCSGSGSYSKKFYRCVLTPQGEKCQESGSNTYTPSCGEDPGGVQCSTTGTGNCGYCKNMDQLCASDANGCTVSDSLVREPNCSLAGQVWSTSGCSCSSGGGGTPPGTPTCNGGVSCGGCSGGSQTCTYTTYSGGGPCVQASYTQSCGCPAGTCCAGTGSSASSCGGHAYYACTSTSPAPNGTCCDFTYRCSGSSCITACHVGVAVSNCGGSCGTPCTPGTGTTNASCGGNQTGCQCNGSSICATQGYYCSTSTSCQPGWSGGTSCPISSCPVGSICNPGGPPPVTPSPPGNNTCTGCFGSGGACMTVTGNCDPSSNCNNCSVGPPVSCMPVEGGSCGSGAYLTCCAGLTCRFGTCVAAPTPAPTYSIAGNVFIDSNGNGTKNPNEQNYTGSITITATQGFGGSRTVTYPASGAFSVTSIPSGTYTTAHTNLPSGYTRTTPASGNSFSVTVGGGCGGGGGVCSGGSITGVNFGLEEPTYTISGSVFLDADGDGIKDVGESNYTGGINISSSGTGDISSYPNPGSYLISQAQAGLRTISYNNLPAGYRIIYPLNGPPPSFQVRVGPACDDGGSPDASCNAQNNIISLNFGIAIDTQPWIQATGGNIRMDSGIDNPIPSTADPLCGGAFMALPGNGGQPGIIYSGASSASFGNGQASSTNWVVTQPDGQVYNPPTPNTIRTAYGYIEANALQQGLTINDIAPQCSGGIANCALSGSLPTGIYKADGNLTLTSDYTFPANRNFIILISGDLTLLGEVHVPTGSTAIFSTSGDIFVDRGVGEVTNTSQSPNLEGIYSADRDFIVRGDNNCSVGPDRRLNVSGNIISNAALSGGSFSSQRDLCLGNTCPSVSIVQRLDLVVNLPPLLRAPNYIWREVAP